MKRIDLSFVVTLTLFTGFFTAFASHADYSYQLEVQGKSPCGNKEVTAHGLFQERDRILREEFTDGDGDYDLIHMKNGEKQRVEPKRQRYTKPGSTSYWYEREFNEAKLKEAGFVRLNPEIVDGHSSDVWERRDYAQGTTASVNSCKAGEGETILPAGSLINVEKVWFATDLQGLPIRYRVDRIAMSNSEDYQRKNFKKVTLADSQFQIPAGFVSYDPAAEMMEMLQKRLRQNPQVLPPK